jgi:hypothetical protein
VQAAVAVEPARRDVEDIAPPQPPPNAALEKADPYPAGRGVRRVRRARPSSRQPQRR